MTNNSEPYYRRATIIAFGFVATNTVGQHIHDTCSISDFGLALRQNLEYLELPNQGWTMFHEDDNHEFGLVNIFLPVSILVNTLLI